MGKAGRGVVAAALLLAGCQSVPQPTRDDWLALTTRQYSGISSETVIAAAEAALRWNRSKSFAFVHNSSGFTATRYYNVYLIIAAENGTDTWQFATRPVDGGTAAEMHVTRSSAGTTAIATPTVGGDVAVSGVTTVSGGKGLDFGPLYELFWARMDYLLGLRDSWPTCRQARQNPKVKDSDIYGLCPSAEGEYDVPTRAVSK